MIKKSIVKNLLLIFTFTIILAFPSPGQAKENINDKIDILKQKLTETVEYAENKNVTKATAEFAEFAEGYEEIEKAAEVKDKQGHEEIEKKVTYIKQLLAEKDLKAKEIEENIEVIAHKLNEIFGLPATQENKTPGNIAGAAASIRGIIDEAGQKLEKGDFAGTKEEISAAYEKYESIESTVKVQAKETHEAIEEKVDGIKRLLSAANPDEKEIKEELRELDLAVAGLSKPGSSEVKSEGWDGLFDAVTILLREGFEALLVFAALLAFLKKSGHADKRKYLYIGGLVGLIASIITAFIIAGLFSSSVASREVLEGIVSLVAAGMLFYVSYWLVSKSNARQWQMYIQGQTSVSLAKNSLFSLGFIAFLAVYREGFETALFYNALLPQVGAAKVVLGIAIGAALLLLLAVALFAFGMRVPIKPFFTVTGVLLYYLAFKFAGIGIRELQEGRVIPETVVTYLPQIGWLGMYSNIETAIAQGVLLLAALGALIFIFQKSKQQGV